MSRHTYERDLSQQIMPRHHGRGVIGVCIESEVGTLCVDSTCHLLVANLSFFSCTSKDWLTN